MAKKFHVTAHLLDRIEQRCISLDTIKDVVRAPEHRIEQHSHGRHGGIVYCFYKSCGTQRIKVVAEVSKKQHVWLMSVMEERQLPRKR